MSPTRHALIDVWVRGCASCGEIDLHSLFPNPDMVDDPGWRCGNCFAGVLAACHVRFPVSRS